MMEYIFGPVRSRRLGLSLGVDPIPYKTCSYDCPYCELGPSDFRTIELGEWVELSSILEELKQSLHPTLDYITLGGAGEPTLFSRTGELIREIKAMTDVPVAVLTNGSLLWRPEVLDQLLEADLIIPSLDGGDEETFHRMNRPHREITFDRLLEGLKRLRERYSGQYWLEVFILAGVNETEESIEKIAHHAKAIQPDRVQLNTVHRPPAEPSAAAVGARRLEALARLFDPPADVVAGFYETLTF